MTVVESCVKFRNSMPGAALKKPDSKKAELRTPKYQLLRSSLLAQVETGRLGSGQRVPSESELIAQFGVSNTTVRRCLNDLAKEGYIHRERGRGSFVSDLAVTALRTSFGILCSSLAAGTAAPSFTAQLTGLEKYASESGHRVELFTSHGLESARQPEKALAHLINQRDLQGLFVISPMPSAWLSELVARKFPVLSLNIDFPDLDIPLLLTDSEQLALQAGRYLAELGHKRIAGLFGQARTTPQTSNIPGAVVRAEKGLLELSRQNPGLQTTVLTYDYFDKLATQRQLADLLKLPPGKRPSGLLVFEETIGRVAWDLANDLGLDVPGDLSIISMQGLSPQFNLTTSSCNYDNLCWRAARVMEQLVNKERPARMRELVSGPLTIGQSTGPYRSA